MECSTQAIRPANGSAVIAEGLKAVPGTPDYARRADFVLMIAILIAAGVACIAVLG